MKKALLAAVCFILVCVALVHLQPTLPGLGDLFGASSPSDANTGGKPVHVTLVTDSTKQMLFPGGTVTRSSVVRNDGEGSACFRLAYAIQYDEESWPHLDISFDADPAYAVTNWWPITVDGTPFMMKVFSYSKAIEPDESSPGVTISITMDHSFTNEQMARFREDFLQIKAMAVDPTPFLKGNVTTITQVLDVALPLNTFSPF